MSTIRSMLHRLALPFVLALALVPLVQAQQPVPHVRCRFVDLDPGLIQIGQTAQLTVELENIQGLDISQLALSLQLDNPGPAQILDTDPSTPEVNLAPGNLLETFAIERSVFENNQIQLQAARSDAGAFQQAQGTLVTAQLQGQADGLVTFTFVDVRLVDHNEAPIGGVTHEPCYLAVGNAIPPTNTPTPTPTPTVTNTVQSPVETPTSTLTTTPPPAAPTFTATPVAPTATPTTPVPTSTVVTPVVTLTPTATATVLVLATPTPRADGLQSPVETPTFTPTSLVTQATLPPVTTLTPDIALTLTAEARFAPSFETATGIPAPQGTPIDDAALPAETATPLSTRTPTTTPTAVEVLSPPRLEDALSMQTQAEQTEEEAAVAAPEESLAASPPDRTAAHLPPASAARVVQQPPADGVLERQPVPLVISWLLLVGAVVCVFSAWRLRRDR